jgi:hypothetical protein
VNLSTTPAISELPLRDRRTARIAASVRLLVNYIEGSAPTDDLARRTLRSSGLLIKRILESNSPESKKELADQIRANISSILLSAAKKTSTTPQVLVAQELLRAQLLARRNIKVPKTQNREICLEDLARLGCPEIVGAKSEAAEFKNGNFIAATQLALSRFETTCRQSLSSAGTGADIGADVVRRAFQQHQDPTAQGLSKIAAGVFQQLRNSMLHPQDTGIRGLEYTEVSGCLSYLASAISPLSEGGNAYRTIDSTDMPGDREGRDSPS